MVTPTGIVARVTLALGAPRGGVAASHPNASGMLLNFLTEGSRSHAASCKCTSCGQSPFGFHILGDIGSQPGQMVFAAAKRMAHCSCCFELFMVFVAILLVAPLRCRALPCRLPLGTSGL